MMSKRKLSTSKPDEIQKLADESQLESLAGALSLLHSWGVGDVEYLPVLGNLLSFEDPEVLRLTLAIMLNFTRGPRKTFLRLKEHLPIFQALAGSNFTALKLIVELCGPSHELVPHLRAFLLRFPEEASDLIVRFGEMAKALVPDLIHLIDQDDWDQAWAAVDALGAIGPSAHAAVPLLEKLTKHKSGGVTGRACVALEQITGKPRTSWPRGPGRQRT